MDVGGEFPGERLLPGGHVYQLAEAEVPDKILAHHPYAMCQETLLPFPAQGGQFFYKIVYRDHFAFPAEAHQLDKLLLIIDVLLRFL